MTGIPYHEISRFRYFEITLFRDYVITLSRDFVITRKLYKILHGSRLSLLSPSGENRIRLGNENKNFVFCFALLSAFTIFAFYE